MPSHRDPDCPECRRGRSHCHGTLIRHSDRHEHCTDDDCVHPEVLLHALAIDCHAVGCRCGDHEARRAAV